MSEYYTDLTVPNRIIKFFENYLCVTTDEGPKPFKLCEFQKEIIRDVFGTYRKSGLRKYKTAYIEIPRGNGKTMLLAGLCLYSLIDTFDAEVVAAAKSRDQASIMLRSAVMMVENSPKLRKLFKVFKNSIYYPKNKSVFKVISRDAGTALGGRLTFGCIDEVLAQPDDALYSSLKSSLTKRKNSLMFLITTAGDSVGTLCSKLHEHAEEIAAGKSKDDSFYAKMYGLGPDDDWRKPEIWKKCNPGLGEIIDYETFEIEAKAAMENPSAAWIFQSRNLNKWFSGEKNFVRMEDWNLCKQNINIDDFVGTDCRCGLDLSSTTDLTCFSMCFFKDQKYYIFPFIFCPEDTIKTRSREDKVLYAEWARQGFIIPTPGNAVDQEFVLHYIEQLVNKFSIKEIAVDRWQAAFISQKFQQIGVEVIGFGQGFASMSEPTKFFERCVLQKRLVHAGNQTMDWAVQCTTVLIDPAGSYKPTKEKKTKNRIDPVVASIMALGRMMVREEQVEANISWS